MNNVKLNGITMEVPKDTTKCSGSSRDCGLLQVMVPTADGFASVGGYQKVKDFLDRRVITILEHPDLTARLGPPVSRGILLFGPSGVGKSLMARALATECNLRILRLRLDNVCWCCGFSIADCLLRAIGLAEQVSPAIIFVDGIDRIVPRRSEEMSDAASAEMWHIHNLFLEWLNNRNRQSIIVGATDRPRDLHQAALRVWRTQYIIPMLYPNAEERREILTVHLGLRGGQPVPLALNPRETDNLITFLAKRTEYWNGAELEHLVNEAKRLAFTGKADTLTEEHFRKALGATEVDYEERNREVEHYLCFVREYKTEAERLPPMRALALLLD